MTEAAVVRTERPATADEAAAVLRAATRERLGVAIVGGGTHAQPAPEAELRLSTARLDRVLAYEPQDQVVTAEAGITLAALGEHLARYGQRLVLDVPRPAETTLGGAIASNDFGPRRLVYGTSKDLVLGVGLVRVDGTPVRAGGTVVKNVAGFDLGKLMVGSYGTLALVTSATLRVHPLPAAVRACRLGEIPASDLWQFVADMRERRLAPVAFFAHAGLDDATYDVDLVFEGVVAGVAAQLRLAGDLAREFGVVFTETDPAASRAADVAGRGAGSLRARITTPANAFARVHAGPFATLRAALDAPRTLVYPGLGIAYVAGLPRDLESLSRALDFARIDVEALRGTLVVETDVPGLSRLIDRWGTRPPAFGLMRALKHRFDPEGRLGPGAFLGGLT